MKTTGWRKLDDGGHEVQVARSRFQSLLLLCACRQGILSVDERDLTPLQETPQYVSHIVVGKPKVWVTPQHAREQCFLEVITLFQGCTNCVGRSEGHTSELQA